jgi:hypothetical protein
MISKLSDIFKLQDDIVHSLIRTLGLQLSVLYKGGPIRQRTSNLDAYDYCLRGVEQLFAFTPTALAKAARMFEKAIALDPGYADPYVGLAYVDWIRYAWQLDTDPRLLESAEQLARKAISLSERAGQRVMDSISSFITNKLKLRVNAEKSAVARPWHRKFLGFSFTNGQQPKRRIAPKAMSRFKQRVRELTRRTRGVSIECMVSETGGLSEWLAQLL